MNRLHWIQWLLAFAYALMMLNIATAEETSKHVARITAIPLRRTTASRKMQARARAGDPVYQRLMRANAHGAAVARGLRRNHATTPDGAHPLHGCPFADFTMDAVIGGTTFDLLVDTGSSTLALAGENCATCAGVTPRWQSTSTSTDMMANAAGQYGDGSGWRARIWHDTVSVGSNTAENLAAPMRLAVITSQSTDGHNADGTANANVGAFFFPDACYDNTETYQNTVMLQGIAGMAFAGLAAAGTDSFPVRLFDAHPTLPKTFAIEMCVHSGNLWLGGSDPASYHGDILYTPVINHGLYWSVYPSEMYLDNMALGLTPDDFTGSSGSYTINIIDSGTTMWELPEPVYRRIVDTLLAHPAFRQLFRYAPTNNFFDHGSGMCETTKIGGVAVETLQRVLPTLTLQFANGLSLTMDGVGSYLLPCTSAYNQWTPGIAPGSIGMIAGWPLMNQFISVHDMENVRIGFAPARACATGVPALRSNVTMGRPIVTDAPDEVPRQLSSTGTGLSGAPVSVHVSFGLLACLAALACLVTA